MRIFAGAGFISFFARRGLVSMFCLAAASAAMATDNTKIQVVSNPLTVSVSRTGGPTFYVDYKVTVTNLSAHSNYVYSFKGTTAVTGSTAVAAFSGSSGIACQLASAAGAPTVVNCSPLAVAAGTSETFFVTFKSPSAGTNLRFTVKPTLVGTSGEGKADTPLITKPIADINSGFETFVTMAGGIFYTGANGNGGAASPGGVATTADPYTTTTWLLPMNFTTTAKVFEPAPDGQNCTPWFTADGCFESLVEIPSAPGALRLTIYFRIDRTKIVAGSDISSVVLKYAKDPAFPMNTIDVQSCAQTGGPTSGNPCVFARNVYGVTIPARNASWYFDWELVVKAVDNGRWVIR